jgi:hypothetical protein
MWGLGRVMGKHGYMYLYIVQLMLLGFVYIATVVCIAFACITWSCAIVNVVSK